MNNYKFFKLKENKLHLEDFYSCGKIFAAIALSPFLFISFILGKTVLILSISLLLCYILIITLAIIDALEERRSKNIAYFYGGDCEKIKLILQNYNQHNNNLFKLSKKLFKGYSDEKLIEIFPLIIVDMEEKDITKNMINMINENVKNILRGEEKCIQY